MGRAPRGAGTLTGFLFLVAAVYLTERWLPLAREVLVPQRPAAPAKEPMPGDLLAVVYRESEEWARDQVRSAMMESYDELGSWDAVRTRHAGG